MIQEKVIICKYDKENTRTRTRTFKKRRGSGAVQTGFGDISGISDGTSKTVCRELHVMTKLAYYVISWGCQSGCDSSFQSSSAIHATNLSYPLLSFHSLLFRISKGLAIRTAGPCPSACINNEAVTIPVAGARSHGDSPLACLARDTGLGHDGLQQHSSRRREVRL